MQIHIPQPCSEDWSAMAPSIGGRFCAKCAHTVIDFSEMSGEEIALYMQLNAGESICGRFREDQLMADLPTPDEFVIRVVKAPLTLLRQIAAIILFALFLGTVSSPAGAQAKQPQVKEQQAPRPHLGGAVAIIEHPEPQSSDTVRANDNQILGRMLIYNPKKDTHRPPVKHPVIKSSQTPPAPHHMAGKVVPYIKPKK